MSEEQPSSIQEVRQQIADTTAKLQQLKEQEAILLAAHSRQSAPSKPFPAIPVVILIAALILLLPSLSYPFGGDAAIFSHVGKAWANGLWPYAGVFDHKPPGIYLVFAILGSSTVWIRLVEGLLLAGMAWLFSDKLGRGGSHGQPVFFLCLVTAYCGFLDFWNTAQTEIWVLFFIVLGWWLALQPERRFWAALGSGMACGCSLVFKHTGVILVPVVLITLWVHLWQVYGGLPSLRRAVLQYTGAWVLGGALVGLATVIPFWWAGAFPAMVDTLIAYDLEYAKQAGFIQVSKWEFLIRPGRLLVPLACVSAGYIAWSRRTFHDRLILWSFVGLIAVAVISVWIQDRYYWYHWGIVLPLLGGLLGTGLTELVERLRWWGVAATLGTCSAIVFLFAPPIYDYFEVSPMTYRKHMAQTAKYWSGGISERDFMVNYYWRSIPMNSFECRDRIIEIGGPKASVCLIDDWSPGVFFQTDFQCPSRFFMSYFVDWLNEEYVREPLKHWKQEFRDTMADTPPDFIVADVEAEILGTAPWFGHEWHEMGDCAGGKLFQRMTIEGEQE